MDFSVLTYVVNASSLLRITNDLQNNMLKMHGNLIFSGKSSTKNVSNSNETSVGQVYLVEDTQCRAGLLG